MKVKILYIILFMGTVVFGQNTEKKETENLIKTEENSQNKQDSITDKKLRDVPWFVERFRLAAGAFVMFNQTNVKIESNSGDGTDVNFEDDLGFNKSYSSFLADIEWRSSSRSRFNLSYYSTKRNSNKRLEKDIIIGDITYHVDEEVYAYMNTDFYRFSYGYAILSKPKYEVGLLIGTHTINTSIGIGLRGESANLELNKSYNVTAPLVDFGVWGGYAFSDRFALKGELNYFQLKIDNFKGSTIGYNFSAVYKVLKNLEVGAGFSGLNFDVDIVTDTLDYNLKWGYNGMTFVAAYTFGSKKWK